MRLLFINTGPWGTGSFTIIQGLAKAFLSLGHEVKILFPDANLNTIDKDIYYKNKDLYHIWKFPITKNNIQLPTFPLMITDPHPRNINPITFKQLTDDQRKLYEDVLSDEIKKIVSSFKPDFIECHHIWYSSWVCNQLNLSYSSVAHHSDQLGFKYDPRMQPKALVAAKHAKVIFAISESVKREILRLYGVNESKIILTKNGYDTEVFKPMKLDRKIVLKKLGLNIPLDASIISFAGKISRTKGIDVIFAASKILKPEMNIHFIIMGSGPFEEMCLKLEMKKEDLRHIHFIGHQTPEVLAKVHNISDIGIMPSKSEGFGLSCLEAMGCGLPMIVTRCGGPETFAVGKIIDRGSPEQLANAIIEILHLPEQEYLDLCKAAQAKADSYSWQEVAKLRLEIYDKIILNSEKMIDFKF